MSRYYLINRFTNKIIKTGDFDKALIKLEHEWNENTDDKPYWVISKRKYDYKMLREKERSMDTISSAQVKRLYRLCGGFERDILKALRVEFGFNKIEEIKKRDYNKVCNRALEWLDEINSSIMLLK